MPAALLAFTAALVLVGVRTLANRSSDSRAANDAAVATTAVVGAPGAPAQELVPVGMPPTASATATGAAERESADSSANEAGSPRESAGAAADSGRAARPSSPPVHVPQRWTPPPTRPKETVAAPAAAPPPKAEPPAQTAAPNGPKPGCESPFAIGPDGIRQIKPECM